MFELDGIKLEFSSTGLEEIAKQALELKTGARGLKTILERVLFNYQFEYEENELYITKDLVREKLGLKEELIDNEVQSRNHRF
jgi:ATP-dependent Clp protease ATP-binding subunit ClpX